MGSMDAAMKGFKSERARLWLDPGRKRRSDGK
jgi:hypothetical protein